MLSILSPICRSHKAAIINIFFSFLINNKLHDLYVKWVVLGYNTEKLIPRLC